jgi:hypothetical protein
MIKTGKLTYLLITIGTAIASFAVLIIAFIMAPPTFA